MYGILKSIPHRQVEEMQRQVKSLLKTIIEFMSATSPHQPHLLVSFISGLIVLLRLPSSI